MNALTFETAVTADHQLHYEGIHLSRDTLVGCVLRTNARAPCWIDKGA